jgi:hypothetical protein
MYRTCAFCSGSLGGDGGDSGLGVGRRLAFDSWKSRAWVICQRCGRWNLTPIDTRIETIQSLDRMAARGRVAATSDQVALVRSGPYDLVRVGQPPRVEMAAWRYGERLKAREREKLKIVVPVTAVAVGVAIAVDVAAGGSMGVVLGQIPSIGEAVYTGLLANRKVKIEPPICQRCGSIMVLKAKHLQHARLSHNAHHDLALLVSCPRCRSLGAEILDQDAEQALRVGLTYANLKKGKRIKKKAEEAAGYVDRHGGPEAFLRSSARLEKTLRQMAGGEALALEMAVDEQAEVRELERQWRQAEEVADIADNLLLDPGVEERLRRLKGGHQPSG